MNCNDACYYLALGKAVVKNGLFHPAAYSTFRTYAYPLIVGLVGRAGGSFGIAPVVSIFEFQLAVFLLSAVVFRKAIAGFSPPIARLVFVATCWNIFVLPYTAEILTESLSQSTILLAASCWLAALGGFPEWPLTKAVLVGSFLSGFAAMIRPANIFLLATWCFGAGLMLWLWLKHGKISVGPAALLVLGACFACTLPMLPQGYNNLKHGRKFAFLVVDDLRSLQQEEGRMFLKYGTVTAPGSNQLHYVNPFASDPTPGAPPVLWYVQHPLRGVPTIALHIFAMLDQDFLFTYINDLHPPYRYPLSFLNHLLIALSGVGIWKWVQIAKAPGPFRLQLRLGGVWLLAYTVCHVAVHGTAKVETRFGLPLLLAVYPLGVFGWRSVWPAVSHSRVVVACTAAVLAYTFGALALSDWMRGQAPLLNAETGIPAPEGTTNLARGRPAFQSSTYRGYGPERGVDGIRERRSFSGFHTQNEPHPWWQVDLGKESLIYQLRLYNAKPYGRAPALRVLLSTDGSSWVLTYDNAGRAFGEPPLILNLSPTAARYVRVELASPNWLHLTEVEVFGK